MDIENGIVRTAGIASGEDFTTTNNGFAIDLGGEYNLTEKLAVSFTVRDIGFISWKEESTNICEAQGDVFTYSGYDDLDDPDLESVTDTIEDVFNSREYKESFSKSLNPEFYYGARYNLTKYIYHLSLKIGLCTSPDLRQIVVHALALVGNKADFPLLFSLDCHTLAGDRNRISGRVSSAKKHDFLKYQIRTVNNNKLSLTNQIAPTFFSFDLIGPRELLLFTVRIWSLKNSLKIRVQIFD